MENETANIVQLLCDLSEASDEVFRRSGMGFWCNGGLKRLAELGAMEPGPRPETVTCNACYADHSAVIEYDAERRCYVHFCPEAGIVTVNDADLITHRFRPEWLVDWLADALHIPSPLRRPALVSGCVWHLGDAACGDTLVTFIFARRVFSQADLDLLVSVLRPIHPADKGLVITTSPHVARQVQLPNGFEFLDLKDIAIATDSFVVNDGLGIGLAGITLNMLGIAKATTTNLGGGVKKIGPADAASPLWMQGTAAQETELKKWLVSHMAAAPTRPQPKAAMQCAAREAGLEFSARAFERSWRIAVLESGASAWSAPGRKPSRRIDTRT
jgi:hypothetical protein